jgi:hypothetical protein
MRSTIATMLALATLATALTPAFALADGDPASDVLIGEDVYYPYSPAVSTSLQNQLNRETAAAARAHFPIKVALIPSPVDLGAIPTLFGKPQQYAKFLEQEISFLSVRPLLLVVMPDGYGTQHLGSAATAVTSLPAPAGAQSNDIARAAIAAVPKLAAAAGHPLKNLSSDAKPAGTNPTLVGAILAAAAITIAVAVLAARRRRATVTSRRDPSARKSHPHRR